jgi:hypothetical protein
MYREVFGLNSAEEACEARNLERLRSQIPLFTPQSLKSCVSLCINNKFFDGLRLLIDSGVPIENMDQNIIIMNNWVDLVAYLFEHHIEFDFESIIRSIRSIKMLDLFLAKGLDINYKMENGCSLLMAMMILREYELIGCTKYELLQALTARGTNIYDTFGGVNGIALGAVQEDNLELLQFCVDHNIDVLSPIMDNQFRMGNLLHACVAANAIKCAQYLLDLGIDRTVTDARGKLPHEIEECGDAEQFDDIKNLIKNYIEPPLIKEPVVT